MANVFDYMGDFFSGTADNFIKIKKELEKAIVRGVMAPCKGLDIFNIKNETKESMTQSGSSTKQSLDALGGQMDGSMKGAFSSKVVKTLGDKSKGYTELFDE